MSAIYPARRALENAVAIPGLRPTRFYAVLLPLWQVETTADVVDDPAYDVIDRFLTRAIHGAELARLGELATFLGLPEALVERCLVFLSRIGHVRWNGDTVQLTPLGVQSVTEDRRYEERESRQVLRVEKLTHRPLLRRHYGTVQILDTPEVDPADLEDRTRFSPLYVPAQFQTRMIHDLARWTDRSEYNLPARLRNLRMSGAPQDGFLPVYLVQTADGDVLAYSKASEERDEFLEAVCREAPTLTNLMDAVPAVRPQEVWTRWLAQRPQFRGTLDRLPSGVWRATLRSDAFGGEGKLPLTRVGSFEMQSHHFLQLWCDDRATRRRAVLERAVHLATPRVVKTRAELMSRVETVARQLDVAVPRVDEILRHARSIQRLDRAASIEELE